MCSKSSHSSTEQNVDGQVIKGVRVITLANGNSYDTVKVYKGDAIELYFQKSSDNANYTIPSVKNVTSINKENMTGIKFTAQDTGSFVIVSNSQKEKGIVMVLEYVPDTEIKIENVNAKEAAKILNDTSIFILDVRTPAEYEEGHIPRAVLVPVYELADKIEDISKYKDKAVFVYCRSGNRSAVAIRILTEQGFKNIVHLKSGIRSWVSEGFELTK
jgi:rhodanese-related sulfurtransferase